jgi:pentatricopeptide repeat protein
MKNNQEIKEENILKSVPSSLNANECRIVDNECLFSEEFRSALTLTYQDQHGGKEFPESYQKLDSLIEEFDFEMRANTDLLTGQDENESMFQFFKLFQENFTRENSKNLKNVKTLNSKSLVERLEVFSKICVKRKTANEFLQVILNETSSDENLLLSIRVLFLAFSCSNIFLSHNSPTLQNQNGQNLLTPNKEFLDLENCLFNLSDYLSRHKIEMLFKLMEISVKENISSLFPIFSLGARHLAKIDKMEESIMLVKYLKLWKIEISTCSINFLIEIFCKDGKVEAAQKLFESVLDYIPVFKFPLGNGFSKLNILSGVNIITYGTLIKGLCKSNHLDLALMYYENLKNDNMLQDEVIFNLLIDGCSKTQNLEQLKTIYCDMLLINICPTVVTYNTIIDAYIRAKDLPSAWKVYDDLCKSKIIPDNFTFSTLFRGIRTGNHKEYLKRSFQILEELRGRASSTPSSMSSFCPSASQVDIILINVLLDTCISMKEEHLMSELFEKVVNNYFQGVRADIITYNTFIKGCAQMNLFDKAFNAFENMSKNVHPNDVTFNTMIDVCVRSNKMSQVWKMIDEMRELGIQPDNFTYSTIIKGLNKGSCSQFLEQGRNLNMNSNEECSGLDLAFKLFENVKRFSAPDEILYNCIMDACLRFEKIDKMMEVYEDMLINKIKPSSITCGIIIKAYGMKGMLDKALEMYSKMKRDNIELSSITYGCLINACIKNDNLAKAFELYEELAKYKIEMNTVLYTTLIKAYARSKNLPKVLEIFTKMKRDKNNAPNNVTYNSVIDCCIKCNEVQLAEKLLEEMCQCDIKPDIITFSTLIKGCLKRNELNKAVDYLNNMTRFSIRPDEVLLNSLLDGCEKMKKFNRAVEIFIYIRKFKVEPSMMSYSIMMKIYGKLGDFQSSKQLMDEVRAKSRNISLIIFTCYMKTCFTACNIEEAMKTYKEIKSYKLIPDAITYTTLLNGLINKKGYCYLSEVILESLKANIILNISIYSDCIKCIPNLHEIERIKEALLSKGVNLSNYNNSGAGVFYKKYDKKPHHQAPIQSENNMTYLIDGYKHKNKKFSSFKDENKRYSDNTDNAMKEKGTFYKNFNNFTDIRTGNNANYLTYTNLEFSSQNSKPSKDMSFIDEKIQLDQEKLPLKSYLPSNSNQNRSIKPTFNDKEKESKPFKKINRF